MRKFIFKDGEIFDLSGPLRLVRRWRSSSQGVKASIRFYVLGQGTLCPVENEAEGRTLISCRKAFLHRSTET